MTSITPDIEVGMDKGRHRQIARFDFEGCYSHDRPYFIYFYLALQKFMDVSS